MSAISSVPSSAAAAPSIRWPLIYLGLGFTTLANLVLELALTRIFSVVFYYHFAFLAISVALFGLGAGGVFSYVVTSRRGGLFVKLGTLAIANSLCVVAALWFTLSRPAGQLGLITLAEVYLTWALPFFFAGTVVSLAISETIERVDRAYFYDLAGAAGGCLLLIPLLNLFGGPNTVVAVGVFYAVSAAIWFNLAGSAKSRAAAVLIALLLVVLLVVNLKYPVLDLRVAKGSQLPPEQFVHWNSFSRVGVSGLSIVIDADAPTAIPAFDWDRLSAADRFELTHGGPGFPYLLRPGAKTVIIGSGGGYDVARALASGSRDITAVEINPIIAETINQKEFVRQNHGLFLRPEVHVVVEDGRSFVRHSREKYQVLQATRVNSWASTAAGAFALTESNLYTSDAFYDYLTHLTDDGLLSFTRWSFDPPRETLRLLSLAQDALLRLGEQQPWRHVIVVREDPKRQEDWKAQDTVLISRKPFSADDLKRVRPALAEAQMTGVYLPDGPASDSPYGQLLLAQNRDTFFAQYPYDVSPLSDNRPFFFYTVQARDLWNYVRHAGRASGDYKMNGSVPLLFGVMVVSIAATAFILLLPRLRSRLPERRGVMTFMWYFFCLGAGYILVQIALIQKFVLLLGHPTYALTVIVFSMLIASGAGSFFSGRIIAGLDRNLMGVLAGVAVLISALAVVVTPLTSAAAGWPLPAKMALTALCISPAAFLMGMPFPSGLRRLEALHPASVRWAWSLNAAASVLGSGGALFLGIYFGLFATLLIGGALYLAALAVTWMTTLPDARLAGQDR